MRAQTRDLVFTIGHGTRTLQDLAAALKAFAVELLVDVRRFPGSRRHPHFARGALERNLRQHGMSYEWWGEALGGRRRGGPGSRHRAWRVESFRAYADHADTDAFRDALARLEETAARRRVTIMCAETLWWRCHRRLIADHLTVRGHEVVHILDAATAEPHRLHEALRVDEQGRPVYDVGATPPLLDDRTRERR